MRRRLQRTHPDRTHPDSDSESYILPRPASRRRRLEQDRRMRVLERYVSAFFPHSTATHLCVDSRHVRAAPATRRLQDCAKLDANATPMCVFVCCTVPGRTYWMHSLPPQSRTPACSDSPAADAWSRRHGMRSHACVLQSPVSRPVSRHTRTLRPCSRPSRPTRVRSQYPRLGYSLVYEQRWHRPSTNL